MNMLKYTRCAQRVYDHKIFGGIVLGFCFVFLPVFSSLLFGTSPFDLKQNIVVTTKKIVFKDFPEAFNPSIVKINEGFAFTFRYTPYRDGHISYIGIAMLNDALELISPPELLITRHRNSITPSQSEDARIFSYRGRLFVIYNDNTEVIGPMSYDRRDMFVAEVFYTDNHFSLSPPLKLFCNEKSYQLWQKNWVPFEWNNILYLGYTIDPHEVLYLNLTNGQCYPAHMTNSIIDWDYGTLRGSSAATLVDGKYLAFFHSGAIMASPASSGMDAWHYFMGAYTFSPDPPFEIMQVSPSPVVGKGFYDQSPSWKKVIFPGGYVVLESHIYLAYGRNDSEMWVAILDKKALMSSLIDVKNGRLSN